MKPRSRVTTRNMGRRYKSAKPNTSTTLTNRMDRTHTQDQDTAIGGRGGRPGACVGNPSSHRDASIPPVVTRGFIGMSLPASLPSLRHLLGSRAGHLEGLHMDLVAHPQLLQVHEAIHPCDPHARPNGQAHLAPTWQLQHQRAFA
jgi:hypothetical protein